MSHRSYLAFFLIMFVIEILYAVATFFEGHFFYTLTGVAMAAGCLFFAIDAQTEINSKRESQP